LSTAVKLSNFFVSDRTVIAGLLLLMIFY